MIEIYDNIISSALSHEIDKEIHSVNTIWNYDEKTVSGNINLQDKNILDSYQFRSVVKHYDEISDGKIYSLVLEMLKQIGKNTKYLLADPYRVKINLIPQAINLKKGNYHFPHVDSDLDHYVLLYYVNDSDGPTYIFNQTTEEYGMSQIEKFNTFTVKEKVEPKKGRFVLFSGAHYHASSSPIENLKRTVININFNNDRVLF